MKKSTKLSGGVNCVRMLRCEIMSRDIKYNYWKCFKDRCEYCNKKVDSGVNDLISVISISEINWDVCIDCKTRWIKHGYFMCNQDEYPGQVIYNNAYLKDAGH